MENTKVTIGQELRRIRKEKGISVIQLSQAIGCTRQHINHMETDVYSCNVVTLQKIAGVLGVPLKIFFENL